MPTTLTFPDNVLLLHDDDFFQFIKHTYGDIVVEILKVQEISSVDSLLRVESIFSFFNLESQHLRPIKERIGIYLNDGSFKVKPGIIYKVETLVRALSNLSEAHGSTTANPLTVLSDTKLQKFPFLQKIINFLENSEDPNNPELTFLYALIENTFSNLIRPKNSYRYPGYIKQFGLTLFVLGGRNLYRFIHMNLPGSLPNVSTLQESIVSSLQELTEGNFRYELAAQHLATKQSKYAFCAEDCTTVIPKIVYDSRSNNFIGFPLPLCNGFPQVEYYSTDDFQQLEHWFLTITQATLLNTHVIQPLSSQALHLSPYMLSAYGSDGRYTSSDIVLRWKTIFDRFQEKSIRILGYSTDCDPKYLRSMRLVTGFFTSSSNPSIHYDGNIFLVAPDPKWAWFYLRLDQQFLCMQDPVHLITKLRNRLLSSTATMLLGNESINVNFLLQLIRDFSKLDHGLVKSDVVPKDRQNYLSCFKISDDCVLQTLEKMKNTRAICIYLKVSKRITKAETIMIPSSFLQFHELSVKIRILIFPC